MSSAFRDEPQLPDQDPELLRRLLRAKDRMDAVRERAQAAAHALDRVPACIDGWKMIQSRKPQ
jgi:hypothetical protein